MTPNTPSIPIVREGLTSAEAARRLKVYGPNRLQAEGRLKRLKEILGTLADPMAVMLLGASVLYFFLGDRRNAVILMGAVLPVLLVDVVLEFRSKQALKKLAEAVSPLARVVRDGLEKEIPTVSLVPGDLLLLKEGDGIPADGAILQCANLQVDESQLTGEAEPVPKKNAETGKETEAGEFARFFAGSTVLTGQASGVVLQTGGATRFGQIAGLVAEGGEEATPLQKKTASIVKQLAVISSAVILWVFITGLWRGSSWPSALLPAVSLGIAVIPEEFPLVLTVFLSLGAWRLAKKGILVKHLASVETLGATTVICVDKTGTLTQGSFQLASHLPLSPHASEEAVLEASVLACELSPADPMEKAILAHTREHGVQVQKVQDRWELVYDYDFDPVGKHMSHVWRKRDNPKAWRIVAKGALEGILEHCDISDQERSFAERENERLAAHGSRVLAVAGKDAEGFTGRRAEDEKGLKLFGLLAFQDPLRPDAPQAVEHCQNAGIHIKIITGDHLLTAHAVADAVGIHHRPEDLLNAAGLSRLSAEDFGKKVRDGVVFARVQPEQKYAIVEALKRSGEVVAMTGDGINDAPALKKADIGVAMGVRGTQVARASADLVLLEDSFASLVDTVAEGRRIFDNIRKAFGYLISFKIPSVGAALICPILGVPLLLLPVHLVWLELIQHPVSALVFEGEPADKDILRRRPRDPRAPLLSGRATLLSVLSGLALAAVIVVLYLRHLPMGIAYARSTALCTYVLGSLMMIWNARAMGRPWWKVPIPRNGRFWIVVGISALSLPLILQTPWLASLFQVEPIALTDWRDDFLLALAATGWRAFGRVPFFSDPHRQEA